MNGVVTYSYQPTSWSQEEFLRLGGFVVVFLNYNKRPSIEKAVRSALAQDFPLVEMFFMDDASSDGSAEIMEDIVRSYSGRHKVSVVRNTENQHICGQWNIVSRLATGNWFGMFCGDDVAHCDRVSLVAERIRQYPTLLALSTAAIDVDGMTGMVLPDSHYVERPYLARGTDSGKDLSCNFKSNGSTAFYNRQLFVDLLPRVPMDDDYLHLRAYVLGAGVDAPIYYYDSSIKTIDYTIGAGITAGGCSRSMALTRVERLYQEFGRIRHLSAMVIRSIVAAINYAQEKNADADLISAFEYLLVRRRIVATNTLGRILILPSVFRHPDLLRFYFHELVHKFFGLKIAAIISCIR